MKEAINDTRYKSKKMARCADCGNSLIGRRGLCDDCRKKLRDYVKNLCAQRGSEGGLCPCCGGVKPTALKRCLACIFKTDECRTCKRSLKSPPGDCWDRRDGLQDVPSLLALLQSARTEIPEYLKKYVGDLSGFENVRNEDLPPRPRVIEKVTQPHGRSLRKRRRRRQ
jgi:hypothetical protein